MAKQAHSMIKAHMYIFTISNVTTCREEKYLAITTLVLEKKDSQKLESPFNSN